MGTNQRKRRANRKQAIGLLIFFALCAVAIQQYYAFSAEQNIIRAQFENPDGTLTAEFRLELAQRPEEIRKGLMYRKPGELTADQGMLFAFQRPKVQSFWMKDTYISLDMLFVNSAKEVVGIIENVPSLNDTSRSVPTPSQYVIELLAGTSKAHGIKKGSRLILKESIPPL